MMVVAPARQLPSALVQDIVGRQRTAIAILTCNAEVSHYPFNPSIGGSAAVAISHNDRGHQNGVPMRLAQYLQMASLAETVSFSKINLMTTLSEYKETISSIRAS
jgi:hypothetical protein